MRNILLLGSEGQIGWELQRSLLPLGRIVCCTRKHCNLENVKSLKKIVDHCLPSIIINAAAFTAVDLAESNGEMVYKINAEIIKTLVEFSNTHNALLIHYSTDYVFDGQKQSPYTEDDIPNPLNLYGKSKLLGEKYIQLNAEQYFIFRISWVYSCRRHNFLKTILNLSMKEEKISVVCDQEGAPSSAEMIADITALILYKIISTPGLRWSSGIYHMTPTGKTTWYKFAQYIIEAAQKLKIPLKLTPEDILPISSDKYPAKAIRPKNSLLNSKKLCDTFGVVLPAWETQVSRTITELLYQGFI